MAKGSEESIARAIFLFLVGEILFMLGTVAGAAIPGGGFLSIVGAICFLAGAIFLYLNRKGFGRKVRSWITRGTVAFVAAFALLFGGEAVIGSANGLAILTGTVDPNVAAFGIALVIAGRPMAAIATVLLLYHLTDTRGQYMVTIGAAADVVVGILVNAILLAMLLTLGPVLANGTLGMDTTFSSADMARFVEIKAGFALFDLPAEIIYVFAFAHAVRHLRAGGLRLQREGGLVIEDVFLIYRDGRLVYHSTRRMTPGMDQDILSGMLVALQEFVKESFKEKAVGHLEEFRYAKLRITLEVTPDLVLAVVASGGDPDALRRKMRGALGEIETEFGDALHAWNGDPERLRAAREILGRRIGLG